MPAAALLHAVTWWTLSQGPTQETLIITNQGHCSENKNSDAGPGYIKTSLPAQKHPHVIRPSSWQHLVRLDSGGTVYIQKPTVGEKKDKRRVTYNLDNFSVTQTGWALSRLHFCVYKSLSSCQFDGRRCWCLTLLLDGDEGEKSSLLAGTLTILNHWVCSIHYNRLDKEVTL